MTFYVNQIPPEMLTTTFLIMAFVLGFFVGSVCMFIAKNEQNKV